MRSASRCRFFPPYPMSPPDNQSPSPSLHVGYSYGAVRTGTNLHTVLSLVILRPGLLVGFEKIGTKKPMRLLDGAVGQDDYTSIYYVTVHTCVLYSTHIPATLDTAAPLFRLLVRSRKRPTLSFGNSRVSLHRVHMPQSLREPKSHPGQVGLAPNSRRLPLPARHGLLAESRRQTPRLLFFLVSTCLSPSQTPEVPVPNARTALPPLFNNAP